MTNGERADAVDCEWMVTGMDCGSCAIKIRNAVERLPGVGDVSVAIMKERLKLTLDEAQTPRKRIEATVRALGFGIVENNSPPARMGFAPSEHAAHDPEGWGRPTRDHHPDHAAGGADHGVDWDHCDHAHMHDDPAGNAESWHRTAKGKLVIVTGVLLGAAWLVKISTGASIGGWAFAAACVIGVVPVARRAFAALRLGQPFTIESLMTIAAVGALFIGAAEEAALVVFLFAVGEVLEGVSVNKARDGIRALANLSPRTALVEEDGATREIPAESLRIGQIALVRPGDRIPADGEVIEGVSGVDESPITGESVPRTRGPGETVFAGSINTEAALRIRVAKTAEDNTISRIIQLVEEAENARAPTERFIDRLSRWYMPVIVAAAMLVALAPPLVFAQPWDTWIYRSLAILLIGCPCALVISVPASIASAMSAGAKRGLLMKGGAVIEAAASVKTVAFDKTGTLTHGRPEVTNVIPLVDIDEAKVIAFAAAVEGASSHPLAQAILRKARGLTAPAATDARAIPGKGVEAQVEGRRLTVASPRYAAERGALAGDAIRRASLLEEAGETVAVLFADRAALGLIALRDEPRADAVEAVRQLRAMGVTPAILTGDNPRTAAAIAESLDAEFQAEMLPEDKLAAIRAMGAQGGVMMVGDGINDAPALKQASVGVAMGSGADVALETADVAILRDRVTDIPANIRLARATMGNIRQNVTIALVLKAVFLVTTVLGFTGLLIAILADTGATVLVTLNALRLLTCNPEKET